MTRKAKVIINPDGSITVTWADESSRLLDTSSREYTITSDKDANILQNDVESRNYGNKGIDWAIGRVLGGLDSIGALDLLGIDINIDSGNIDPFGNYLNIDRGDRIVEILRSYVVYG
jgi:hypothetical protein